MAKNIIQVDAKRIGYASKENAFPVFTNVDIATEVMKFLGIRSLVAFGLCSNSLNDSFRKEINRRKNVFLEHKKKVKELLQDENLCRANVLRAHKLYKSAERLVDDELGFLAIPRRCLRGIRYPFQEEVEQFMSSEANVLPGFHMFPLCFYIPPDIRALPNPSTEHLAQARNLARRLSGIEHIMMNKFYDMIGSGDPFYSHPKFPFDKFRHPLSEPFHPYILYQARKLQSKQLREAFRFAARETALSHPRSQDCLHYVLHMADRDDNFQQLIAVQEEHRRRVRAHGFFWSQIIMRQTALN